MEMKITWSTLAKQQLKDIGQYVADNFGERTANKSLERIVKKVNGLYVFPESGSFDKKYSTDSYTVRHLTIHPNVVYYIQFANQITIMAVAHEKQSPKTVSSMITHFIEHHMPLSLPLGDKQSQFYCVKQSQLCCVSTLSQPLRFLSPTRGTAYVRK